MDSKITEASLRLLSNSRVQQQVVQHQQQQLQQSQSSTPVAVLVIKQQPPPPLQLPPPQLPPQQPQPQPQPQQPQPQQPQQQQPLTAAFAKIAALADACPEASIDRERFAAYFHEGAVRLLREYADEVRRVFAASTVPAATAAAQAKAKFE